MCFSVGLGSSLSERFLAKNPKRQGATMTVKDHGFVWLWDETIFDFCCVVLIKDCTIKLPMNPL